MELLINLNNIVAMKKIVLLFVSLASLMISCSTDEDLAFSCDPIVDQWVKANYNELQTISRQDFISLPDESYQRATYASFSPQKQMELWETKINEALELDWTPQEKEHILTLESIIKSNPHWFQNEKDISEYEDQAIEDEITLQMYVWIEYARTHFNWNSNVIYALLISPNKIVSKDGQLFHAEITRSSITINPGDEGSIPAEFCDCSVESDYCPTNFTCKEGSCFEPTVDKCGFFLKYSCDGLCK